MLNQAKAEKYATQKIGSKSLKKYYWLLPHRQLTFFALAEVHQKLQAIVTFLETRATATELRPVCRWSVGLVHGKLSFFYKIFIGELHKA